MRELDVDRDTFFGWIVLHELTHVFQFQGVPWLRDHLGGLVREYLATVEVRIERGAAGGLPSLPDPAKLVEAFREGGLAALVQTREQRALMDRMQAVMAVIEGYSEHVMDALGERCCRTTRGCATRWTPPPQPLGAGAADPAPAGARPEAAPVRGRQAVLRRGGGAARDRGAEPGLVAPRRCRRAELSSAPGGLARAHAQPAPSAA